MIDHDVLMIEEAEDGMIEVKGFKTEPLPTLVIPEGVTRVAEYAFHYCRVLTDVVFPSTLREVGNMAFFGCERLKSAPLPASLTAVGDYAFFSCKALDTLTLPENLETIGVHAFSHCGFRRLEIPARLQRIGEGSFSGGNVTHIAVDPKNPRFLAAGNCLIDKETACLLLGCTDSVIPPDAGITAIGESAFGSNSRLKELSVPRGIRTVKAGAFQYSGLTCISLPDGMTSIERSAFSGCRDLRTVTLPDSITTIGISAFAFCKLTEIKLPRSLRSIKDSAFFYCPLRAVDFPEGLTHIGGQAFFGCSLLERVSIPASIVRIEREAFSEFEPCGREHAIRVEFGGTKEQFSKIYDADYFDGLDLNCVHCADSDE